MNAACDASADIQARVAAAAARRTPLVIRGGGTKPFLGRPVEGEPLELGGHRGIVHYDAAELVLTARTGTPLDDIEALLAEHGQMLAFEPPHFGPAATLGGTIAANLSGPRRAYAGAARDFVLGTRVVNGRGEILRFGGEVMKNVAGYDVSRLLAGSMGTLGVILEVSLKVLPRPRATLTTVQHLSQRASIEVLCQWGAMPLPLSASYAESGELYVRLSGTVSAVEKARSAVGGDVLPNAEAFWHGVREQQRPFFRAASRLWRLSVPPAALLRLPGTMAVEWGGALRWLATDAAADTIRNAVAERGGHAMLFRGGNAAVPPCHPLSKSLLALHRRIKHAMDPQGILNPGRLYAEL